MFVAPIEFEDVRHWFLHVNHTFSHLCIFLNGNGEYNDIINQAILENRLLIDRTTGNGICYFFCTSSRIRCDINDFNKWNVRNRENREYVDKMLDKRHNRIDYHTPSYIQSELLREDVCDCYQISRSYLPALVFINKKEKVFLYPIQNFENIRALLTPLGIISDFLSDKKMVDQRIRELERLRRGIKSNEPEPVNNSIFDQPNEASYDEYDEALKQEKEKLAEYQSICAKRLDELNLEIDAHAIVEQTMQRRADEWLISILKASAKKQVSVEPKPQDYYVMKCFIAGSKSLERERDTIISGINDQNLAFQYTKRRIECYTYKNFETRFIKGGQQDTYSDFIKKQANIVIFALDEVIGGITKSEFNDAVETLLKNNYETPIIFVFSNTSNEGKSENPEIQHIRQQVNSLKQYWIDYSSLDMLKLKLQLTVVPLYTKSINTYTY